jgi:NAD(P)-dependent dehydrogenase (short-subunit alcohol dehydrogenase family)
LLLDWEEDNITVNVVMPSYVATPMTHGVDLSHDHSGKLLKVEAITEAVWQAATTHGMYWALPGVANLQWALVRKIPLRWVPGLARMIFKKGMKR